MSWCLGFFVNLVLCEGSSPGEPDFDGLKITVELGGVDGEFLRGEFSENMVGEILPGVTLATNADAEAGKGVGQILEDAGDAVVSAIAAACAKFHRPGFKCDVVVDDEKALGRNLMILQMGGDAAPALIHVGVRFEEPKGSTGVRGLGGSGAAGTRDAGSERGMEAGGEGGEHVVADVMAGIRVFETGIS